MYVYMYREALEVNEHMVDDSYIIRAQNIGSVGMGAENKRFCLSKLQKTSY